MANTSVTRLPFVSIQPLSLDLLPPHPSLPASETAIPLREFVEKALTSAEEHVGHFTPFETSDHKSSAPSIAKVGVKIIKGWAVRKSVHESKAEKGTATWEEIRTAVAYNHSENEAEYTPTIKYSHQCLNWEIPPDLGEVNGWTIKQVAVYESVHHLPFPLNDRVFPLILISALSPSEDALTIVSIPVDASNPIPGSNLNAQERAKHVYGKYTAVERIAYIPSPAGNSDSANGGTIEWLMGTDSDAGGNLPKKMIEKSVPGQIAKDVGLCIGWIDSKRKV